MENYKSHSTHVYCWRRKHKSLLNIAYDILNGWWGGCVRKNITDWLWFDERSLNSGILQLCGTAIAPYIIEAKHRFGYRNSNSLRRRCLFVRCIAKIIEVGLNKQKFIPKKKQRLGCYNKFVLKIYSMDMKQDYIDICFYFTHFKHFPDKNNIQNTYDLWMSSMLIYSYL